MRRLRPPPRRWVSHAVPAHADKGRGGLDVRLSRMREAPPVDASGSHTRGRAGPGIRRVLPARNLVLRPLRAGLVHLRLSGIRQRALRADGRSDVGPAPQRVSPGLCHGTRRSVVAVAAAGPQECDSPPYFCRSSSLSGLALRCRSGPCSTRLGHCAPRLREDLWHQSYARKPKKHQLNRACAAQACHTPIATPAAPRRRRPSLRARARRAMARPAGRESASPSASAASVVVWPSRTRHPRLSTISGTGR